MTTFHITPSTSVRTIGSSDHVSLPKTSSVLIIARCSKVGCARLMASEPPEQRLQVFEHDRDHVAAYIDHIDLDRLAGMRISTPPRNGHGARQLRKDDPGPNIWLLYLNDALVGRGSVNRRDDVLLVQFFLNALWGQSPDKKTIIGDSGKPLAIDGVCGRVTIAAIETFQKWYWQQPNFTDGRVEPLSKEPNFPAELKPKLLV